MKVQILTERGDALIATAARASFNRRADQYTDDRHGDHVVNINPHEWPAIRAAVNKLIKECKE